MMVPSLPESRGRKTGLVLWCSQGRAFAWPSGGPGFAAQQGVQGGAWGSPSSWRQPRTFHLDTDFQPRVIS